MNPTNIQLKGALPKDDNGSVVSCFNYTNITTTATTLIKTGPGFLHSIVFNGPVATGTVKIDDAITDTTPVIGTITTPASPMPVTIIYDIEFINGLTIVTGTAAQNITVVWL